MHVYFNAGLVYYVGIGVGQTSRWPGLGVGPDFRFGTDVGFGPNLAFGPGLWL